MKMSLKSLKNRMCEVKYLFLSYCWMLICDLMNVKTETHRLSGSVQILKCFKWDTVKTMLSMKNETMLELFNFCGIMILF